MKIKRTKPGTKTSEAKHEIVKAEQNGTSSSADDSNSSNSGSKKHSQITQPTPPVVVPSPVTTPLPTTNKRGNSSHRRDKARDKTPHSSVRDKSDHISSSASSMTSNSTSVTNDRTCNCTNDMQINGIQTPCSSLTCIRIRTTDSSNTPLNQRLSSNQNNSK